MLKKKAKKLGAFSNAKPRVTGKNIVNTKERGPIKKKAAAASGSLGGFAGNSGGAVQSASQSPLYYDYRYSTPDKYYFPRNRVVANSIWRSIYMRDPAIATATDMYAELPWSEFDIVGIDDKSIKETYESMFDSLDIIPKMQAFTRDYLITGELIIHAIFNSSKGFWDRVIPHDPDYVKVEGVPLLAEQPLMWLLPTPEIKNLLNSTDPRVRKLQKVIPREIRNAFRMNREIPLDGLNTTFIPRLNASTDIRGTSIYSRLFRIVMYEDFIVNASLAVAQRNAAPLRIFKLGDPNTGWLPDEEDEAAFMEMLSIAESDPLAAIVMHHNVSVDLVGVSDRMLLISKEWDFIERVKLLALGVAKSFLVGETSFACFEEGTPVIAADGTPVPIEKISNGDYVLDQYGRASKVVNNWCEGVPDEVLEFEVWGGRKFRVTPNHRFPVWQWPTECACGCGQKITSAGRAFSEQKHAAKCSHSYKKVTVPATVHHGRHKINTIPNGYDPNRTTNAENLRPGDFLKVPKHTANVGTDTRGITANVARLIGYYLAEGSISWSKLKNGERGNPCSIILSFGAHEKDTWAADVKRICDSLGIKCRVVIYQSKPQVCTVKIIPKNKEFVNMFIKLAGELAKNKKLSSEVFSWPDDLIQELITGYFRGDGCRSQKATPAQKRNNCLGLPIVQCGTVSKDLATQLILLLARLGYPTGHAITDPDCSTYNRIPYHILRIQGKAAINLANVVWGEQFDVNFNNCSVWEDEEFMYVPIRAVRTVKNTKKVYNLEVEGDHTYLICDGLATHNSAVAGLQTLLERLSSLRQKFENEWILKKLCKPVAEINEFYKTPQSHIDHRIRIKDKDKQELIMPKIKWRKNLEPTQDPAILGIWKDLHLNGLLSNRTYSSGAGLDLDVERRNMQEEAKYKKEHPEIYGPPPESNPPAGGGAPGGGAPPGGAPKPGGAKPGGGEGLPMPPPPKASMKKYSSDNPYAAREEVADHIAEEVDQYADGRGFVHVDDVKDAVTDSLDSDLGRKLDESLEEYKIPPAGINMLTGVKSEI